MVREGPVGGLAVQRAGQCAVPREMLDQDRQPARGEVAAVPAQQVDPVVAEQISFQGLGVLFDELAEAQSSPRPSPVSLP